MQLQGRPPKNQVFFRPHKLGDKSKIKLLSNRECGLNETEEHKQQQTDRQTYRKTHLLQLQN